MAPVKIHVGAYAAAGGLDDAGEAALYAGLEDLGVAGIEQPFFKEGRLHPRDDGRLVSLIPPSWSLVLTLLPGTMERLKDDPHFGLASADADGRRRALDFCESARRTLEHLAKHRGHGALAVHVHSAPKLGTGAKASLERFIDSLSTLRAMDWGGATLLVEHCDAFAKDRSPEKGFLPVEDEVLALKRSKGKTPAALSVNWGRSALETRSAQGPLDHLARAAQAEMLGGLFFSGVTPAHPDYGAWKDSHAPFSTTVPESLLTPDAAAEALAAAPDVPLLGLKLQTLPSSMPVEKRLSVLETGLSILRARKPR